MRAERIGVGQMVSKLFVRTTALAVNVPCAVYSECGENPDPSSALHTKYKEE